MKVIGLTGPSGAGKGELGRCLASRGIPVIDADRVYHELLVPPSPCLDELGAAFGPAILSENGTLDRTAMAALVFGSDAAAKERHEALNRITHRYVTERIRELLTAYAAAGTAAAVIDAPLLIEAGMDRICDVVIAVLCDRETRLARLGVRDGKSREALLARLSAQPDDDFYRSHADVVVENDGDVALLQKEADRMLANMEIVL